MGPADDTIPNSSLKELREAVTDKNMVEWQSIPWGNHGDSSQMTVNLAANNGLLDWKHHGLEEETIVDLKTQRKLTQEATSFSTDEVQSQELMQHKTTDELQKNQNDTQESFAMSFASNASCTSNTPAKRKGRSGSCSSRKRQKRML